MGFGYRLLGIGFWMLGPGCRAAETQEQLFAMDAAAANRTGEQTKQIFEKIDASEYELRCYSYTEYKNACNFK